MAAATKEMTKKRLTRLLGLVQEADTPEQRDKAWDEIVAAFNFTKRKGALANPLIAEMCVAVKGRLAGVGYDFDEREVDAWFAGQDEDLLWFNVIGPMINNFEDQIAGALSLERPVD